MENNIMIPIFGEDGVYRKVREMIKDSLNILVSTFAKCTLSATPPRLPSLMSFDSCPQLNQGDPLPRKICCKCYFKLQQACQLKSDMQRSTRFFIQQVSGQRSPESVRVVRTLQSYLV